jgi:hypothetical protein
MICKTCGAIVPDKFVACQACLERHARREAMPAVLAGKRRLKLVRYAGKLPHIASISDPAKAWCGYTVSKAAHRLPLELDDLFRICDDCRQEFERLAKERRAEVA